MGQSAEPCCFRDRQFPATRGSWSMLVVHCRNVGRAVQKLCGRASLTAAIDGPATECGLTDNAAPRMGFLRQPYLLPRSTVVRGHLVNVMRRNASEISCRVFRTATISSSCIVPSLKSRCRLSFASSLLYHSVLLPASRPNFGQPSAANPPEEQSKTTSESLSSPKASRGGARNVPAERTGEPTSAVHFPRPEESTAWITPELSPK